MKKILIISDAWDPQTNGVVRTLQETIKLLSEYYDVSVDLLHPGLFNTVKSPYPDVRLTMCFPAEVADIITEKNPDFIHISVEGPLGIAARSACKKLGLRFTTAYHTKFPEYLKKYYGIPLWTTYTYFRWFHSTSSTIMCSTRSLKELLLEKKFTSPIGYWSRGVDTLLFEPAACLTKAASEWHKINPRYLLNDHESQDGFILYVGRVSSEKGIEDFCSINTKYAKVVVGDGPSLEALKQKYPDVHFIGKRTGKQLAGWYAQAKMFIFPSKTDTFGLVVLEALSSGTPVIAYDVPGPKDILLDGICNPTYGNIGKLVSESLGAKGLEDAVNSFNLGDLSVTRRCRSYVLDHYTWKTATKQFFSCLVPVRD